MKYLSLWGISVINHLSFCVFLCKCFPSLKKLQLPSLSKLPFKSIDQKFLEKSKTQLNAFLQVKMQTVHPVKLCYTFLVSLLTLQECLMPFQVSAIKVRLNDSSPLRLSNSFQTCKQNHIKPTLSKANVQR